MGFEEGVEYGLFILLSGCVCVRIGDFEFLVLNYLILFVLGLFGVVVRIVWGIKTEYWLGTLRVFALRGLVVSIFFFLVYYL